MESNWWTRMFTISCKVAQQVCPLTRQLSAIKYLVEFLPGSNENVDQICFEQKLNFRSLFKLTSCFPFENVNVWSECNWWPNECSHGHKAGTLKRNAQKWAILLTLKYRWRKMKEQIIDGAKSNRTFFLFSEIVWRNRQKIYSNRTKN